MEALDMSQFEILNDRPSGRIPPREVLRHGIMESILDEETALFDVLPGIGKSRSISKIFGTVPVSIFTNFRDNYEQFERWGKEDGIEVEKFPVATDLCPVLRSENPAQRDDPIVQKARNAHDDGWPVRGHRLV
ncbi:hypothetical protein [Natronococcus roseus]|uniref:hypothetical protein n=1 Tax=Natronococcus roseus TaxID=1052014 RepID=UPI00374CDB9A